MAVFCIFGEVDEKYIHAEIKKIVLGSKVLVQVGTVAQSFDDIFNTICGICFYCREEVF
jgi:hypothetical protein